MKRYDAVVVGARVAGSATAMLLARRGWRVLALERSEYGSDTPSTHALMKAGVIQLHRWGLLDAVVDAGTPPVRSTTFHYGDESVDLPVKATAGVDALYAPRRTVLDPIIADAAIAAGADVRFGTKVTAVLQDAAGVIAGVTARDAAGATFDAHAPIVIGADGVGSLVARAAEAQPLLQATSFGSVIYAYFADPDRAFSGYEWSYRLGSAAGVMPTNGGIIAWVDMPPARFDAEARGDAGRSFWSVLAAHTPDLGERLGTMARTSGFRSHRGRPGFLRPCTGDGWALVGDASHFTDPLSAHGLTDALRDAELLARAVDRGLADPHAMAMALAPYERERDRLSLPMLDASDRVASYRWSMEHVRSILLDVSAAMRDEVDVVLSFDRAAALDTAPAPNQAAATPVA